MNHISSSIDEDICLARNDLIYVAGTCLQHYMGKSRKLEAPELIKELGNVLLKSGVYKLDKGFYPPTALQVLVMKVLPTMLKTPSSMIVEKNGSLTEKPACYAVRDGLILNDDMSRMLENICDNRPVLANCDPNAVLSEGDHDEIQSKRMVLGNNFFADMEKYLRKNKDMRFDDTPKPSTKELLVQNILSLFRIGGKKKDKGYTP